MIQIPGRIPILIHPFFWLFAALIGWMASQSISGIFIWVGIIFVSVLFHEYGHALMAVLFRQRAQIQLIALGGVTSFEGPKLKFWQQFLVTFNGPFFGFLIFLGATLALRFPMPSLLFQILKATQVANLFWTIVNLLPVLPLDGGQLLRIALEAAFGVRGFKAALFIGAIFASFVALGSFLKGFYLLGAFFFLFAFQSFDSFRKSRLANPSDRDEGNRELMMSAEKALQEGNNAEAKRIFEEIREKAQGGVLALAATQYLALLLYQEGEKKKSYDLLLSLKENLSDELLVVLHELAALEKNYPLVIELSAKTFQIAPSQKMALRNARAFAAEVQAKPAGGWLQTAMQYGGVHLDQILEEPEFEKVKHEAQFQEFIKES